MPDSSYKLNKNTISAAISTAGKNKTSWATGLAGIAVISSAFAFWPFENNKIWQMLNIPNLCCGIALAITASLDISKKHHQNIKPIIPHLSILTYLTINILSISFADTLARPLNYTLKLALVFTGGLFLFQKAISKPKTLNLFYILIAIAASLSISACIYTRLACDPKQFGFHNNLFKYGTYIAILAPLAGIYLLSGSKLHSLSAILIITASLFSVASAGAILAIFAGLITALILSKKPSTRIAITICILLSAAIIPLSNTLFNNATNSDFALKETSDKNLKQRYIEWQAEINLLEKRGIIGTGPGCINDYRSNFYYRLPKLNTLKAFDQNGFLAIGAETGLLSLAAFFWILIHYSTMSLKNCIFLQTNKNPKAHAMATANTAALVSAMTANLFSSVHYNGVLIIFVLLISLISSVNRIYGENISED